MEYDFDVSRKIAEVLIRKVPDDQQVSDSIVKMCFLQIVAVLDLCPPPARQFLDLRVAVLGNVDSGKSTLLGVLTQGELDNGRGRARLNLFRHLHEIQTGRTSSISFEILGFNSKGEVSIDPPWLVQEIAVISVLSYYSFLFRLSITASLERQRKSVRVPLK